MKKTLCFVCTLVWALAAFAQTGIEIVNRMNETLKDHDSEGVSMYIDIKIPIVGVVSTRTMHLGDKTRMEFEVSDNKVIVFMEDTIQWIYLPQKNEVAITSSAQMNISNPAADSGMDIGMFDDISEGYDISIKSENLVKWELICKKKRSNPDKDAPKNISLVVRKDSYNPISLSTKMMGVTCTMRDFTFGITEKDVTFNEADYPGVTISDQR